MSFTIRSNWAVNDLAGPTAPRFINMSHSLFYAVDKTLGRRHHYTHSRRSETLRDAGYRAFVSPTLGCSGAAEVSEC